MPSRSGEPCQAPDDDNEDGICGFEGVCSTWYGKAGHQFCSSHRAAWTRWRKEGYTDADVEQPSYLTSMEDLLGTRFCEPSKMDAPARYNDIDKTELEFCVQGTFTVEGYVKGATDTRWQSLQQLSESCSRENFEELTKSYIKELQATFKRSAKRFKTAAQLARE